MRTIKDVPVRRTYDGNDWQITEKRTIKVPEPKEIAEEIKKRIRKNPSKLNMDSWHCGTAHCIGGWCSALYNPAYRKNMKSGYDPTEPFAAAVLGLRTDRLKRLFHVPEWPRKFQKRLEALGGESTGSLQDVCLTRVDDPKKRREAAEIVCDVIDHYVK